MTLYHLFVLAVIQGVTEFLPVSSSGHLILLPGLTGTEDQGLAIDVAVHVGTLFAVVAFFWSDVKSAVFGLLHMLRGQMTSPEAVLALNLIIATIPVVIVGFILHVTGWVEHLRSVAVIGWTMFLFGIVLYWADRTGATSKTAKDWTLRDAVVFGLAQAVSLIPGTSRSGITITAGRKLGYDREGAARLSMLMSIPTILASGVLLTGDAVAGMDMALLRYAAIGAVFAFVSALLALVFMMRLLRTVSFTPYVIYRVILGVILLLWAYS